MAHPNPVFMSKQLQLASNWGKFGDIVDDYLGIPYIKDGRAVTKVTGKPAGVATKEAGLVCTSFVDVVLSRYIHDDAEMQLDSYKFGDGVNIFDKYGLPQLRTNVMPSTLANSGLLKKNKIYGVVFHMKNAWTKKTKKKGLVRKPPGSRIHVGFLAYHNNHLFLIHASGKKKGVHVVAWQRFLMRFGPELKHYGGNNLIGPKFLSIYHMIV